MNGHPNPEEDVLLRTDVRFATGVAAPVNGLRSFRDFRRNDISAELAGWPAAPPFAPHGTVHNTALRTGRFLVGFVGFAVAAAAEILGNGGVSGPDVRDAPTERDNEVHDFPVMWADPRTIARTLPWQLDPGRRPNGHRTVAVATDRRLIILGTGAPDGSRAPGEEELLWQAPYEWVATAECMTFSGGPSDLRITFTDGSWVRLGTGNSRKLAGHLTGRRRELSEAELTAAQAHRSAEFIASVSARHRDRRTVTHTRMAGGNVLLEVKPVTSKTLYSIEMDDAGTPIGP